MVLINTSVFQNNISKELRMKVLGVERHGSFFIMPRKFKDKILQKADAKRNTWRVDINRGSWEWNVNF